MNRHQVATFVVILGVLLYQGASHRSDVAIARQGEKSGEFAPCGPANDYCEENDTPAAAIGPLESGNGIQAYPDAEFVLLPNLASLLYMAGRFEEALAVFERYFAILPEQPLNHWDCHMSACAAEIAMRLASTHRMLGDEEAALVAAQMARQELSELRSEWSHASWLHRADAMIAAFDQKPDAAVKALHAGFTHYGPSRGFTELRESIAAKLTKNNLLEQAYDPNEEILVTHGGVHAYYLAMQSILNPGDEVLIPDPGWATHSNMVKLLRGNVVSVEARHIKNLVEFRHLQGF